LTYYVLDQKEVLQKSDLLSSPFPLINAVIANDQDGKIFNINGSFFILHKSEFSYFKSSSNLDSYDTILNFLTQTEDIPGYFHVYDPPKKLVDACIKNSAVNIKLRNRIQLRTMPKEALPTSEILQDFYIDRISEENFNLLEVFDLNLSHKFWRSKEDFLSNGFGFCSFTAMGQPTSVCYTACIAKSVAEIDIATLPNYRQKGLAKLVTSAFLKHCNENGIIANWDCFEDNTASLKTALNIGFEKTMNYQLLSIYNKSKKI